LIAVLEAACTLALGRRAGVQSVQPVTGGCIHRCFRVESGSVRLFIKTNDARHALAFEAEADGLAALRQAGLRAPEALARGVEAGFAFLVLEFIELGAAPDFAALGALLAEAHRGTWPRFGWHRDNFLGTTPQPNGETRSWTEFWCERRLKPQARLARKRGVTFEVERLARLLEGHEPHASLLHGDLWSGNVGFSRGLGPVVFDPAVYCGDREADLAMTELFGGFGARFYAAYREAWPLDPGYERRRPLYNLYHLLNHLHLFGATYLPQVRTALDLLLR
jgi:protein-ribulosamine 3-kinase